MKRILLTGGTGFIGRHCVPLLRGTGDDVHVVAVDAPPGRRDEVQWHRADLTDPDQIGSLMATVKPTHLLHLAWYVNPRDYQSSLENFRWVQAGLSLLEAFAVHGGARLVTAGTCLEYDWAYGKCSEHLTPLRPSTVYGECKAALGALAARLAERAGFRQAWGRIFYVFGPHEPQTRLVPFVIRSLLHAEPARCSHGRQIRDFLYVEDVASALVSLLESDVDGAVNIASGEPVRVAEVVDGIAERLGRRDLVRLGDRPTPEGEAPIVVADTQRLRTEVGWIPRYGLGSGLDRTIDWWKENDR